MGRFDDGGRFLVLLLLLLYHRRVLGGGLHLVLDSLDKGGLLVGNGNELVVFLVQGIQVALLRGGGSVLQGRRLYVLQHLLVGRLRLSDPIPRTYLYILQFLGENFVLDLSSLLFYLGIVQQAEGSNLCFLLHPRSYRLGLNDWLTGEIGVFLPL